VVAADDDADLGEHAADAVEHLVAVDAAGSSRAARKKVADSSSRRHRQGRQGGARPACRRQRRHARDVRQRRRAELPLLRPLDGRPAARPEGRPDVSA
jgi:hypothetical protein